MSGRVRRALAALAVEPSRVAAPAPLELHVPRSVAAVWPWIVTLAAGVGASVVVIHHVLVAILTLGLVALATALPRSAASGLWLAVVALSLAVGPPLGLSALCLLVLTSHVFLAGLVLVGGLGPRSRVALPVLVERVRTAGPAQLAGQLLALLAWALGQLPGDDGATGAAGAAGPVLAIAVVLAAGLLALVLLRPPRQ